MGMAGPWYSRLSRRERQIMDILFRRGRAPARVVREELPGDPNSSTVRTQLRILEKKGHVRHEEEGLRSEIPSFFHIKSIRRNPS